MHKVIHYIRYSKNNRSINGRHQCKYIGVCAEGAVVYFHDQALDKFSNTFFEDKMKVNKTKETPSTKRKFELSCLLKSVVLANSFLNVVLVFYLSFFSGSHFKALKHVYIVIALNSRFCLNKKKAGLT